MSVVRLPFLIPCLLIAAASCDSKKSEPVKPIDPAASYREKANAKDLYAVLNKQVQNHDPIDKVQRLLGTGTPGDADAMTVVKRLATNHPTAYPESVEDADTLIEYKMDEQGQMRTYLQFRRNLLVNHNQEGYASFEPSTPVAESQPQSAPSSAPATSTATSPKD
jgi:hypothetical protein